MNYWWLTNFARLAAEKRSVEGLADEGWFTLSRWSIFDYRLGAEGVLHVHGADYAVRLMYPDQFPLVPAWVEPQDPTVRWSYHQYGAGGVICSTLRPDTWHPGATGADVLRSAYDLLHIENPLGEGPSEPAPSGHRVGAIQSYSQDVQPVLVSEGCLARIRAGTATGVSALRWMADEQVWPMLVFDDIERARPEHPPSFDFSTLRAEVPVRIGKSIPTAPSADRAALAVTAQADLNGLADDVAVLVIALGTDEAVPYHSPDATKVHRRVWVVLPDDAGLRSGRVPAAAGKRVAIIGLGSVGAKLAESLVRSGVRHVLLGDGDIFLPPNIERHTLDWRDVGFRKVDAVARRLRHIVPGVEILTIPSNLDWQRSAKTQAANIDLIASSDLVIDATGSVPSTLFLGAIAAQNAIPFVSIAVFEGGIGCLLARSIPGRDPTYSDGRVGYISYCDAESVSPPSSGQRSYEAIGEDGTPVVADDAAVTMAAGHAARCALDILDDLVGDEDEPWMLIGFRKAWLFTRHGHVISLAITTAAPAEAERDADAEAFAVALAKGALHAA